MLVFTVVSLYIVYDPAPSFIAASTCALILESAALLLCLIHLTKGANNKLSETTKIVTKKMFNIFSEWYPWHVFGGILVSLPMVVILTNFTCHSNGYDNTLYADNSSYFSFLATEENKKLALHVELRDHYYTLLVLIGLIHFCNFTQLNFFMKSILALIAGTIYIVLIERINCQHHNKSAALFVSRFLQENVFSNITERADQKFFLSKSVGDFLRSSSLEVFDAQNYYNIGIDFLNLYYNDKNVSSEFYLTNSGHKFFDSLNQSIGDLPKDEWMKRVLKNIGDEVLIGSSSETILNICIIIFLVIVLNREFEISYRLSYYCNTESSKDKMRVQNMKNQADWLLENIIPKHVSIELKNRAKYCKNHSNVGIIFASIVNFNKLYDESYSGGKEYLRVLNELISDFDELLNSERFKNVDKIKTIGSTFMGASGLNPALRKENKTEYEHIFELMDFALEMYKVVEVFNSDLLGFNLILRVGFNIGEVTAGVIGRSKLFYDIWGDAVNVASRMDSCGVDGRIQVPHSCLSILSEKYSFEPRGSVSVKGKGDILVYLVKN